MKSILKVFNVTFLIIFIGINAYSKEITLEQPSNETSETDTVKKTFSADLVCSQLNNALQYLKDNKIFSKKFRMDYKIRSGWGYNIFLTEYLSYKLNVSENDVWRIDNEKRSKALIHLKESVPYEDTLMFIDNCKIIDKTKKKSKWTILISKTDAESMLVQFSYKKRPDLHGSGLMYLFFYDEHNEIVSFYKTSWIE
ncbi:hypothetical protein [Flammeovirga sp. SJP92]|uniref:hypothetical protein n=1 Tax=Flammeovirga sp. SJP92 TaxID=1775430 RepID=UPI0012FC86F7|nr:hypothetical protein [Flammeovirga sp. SJP92]